VNEPEVFLDWSIVDKSALVLREAPGLRPPGGRAPLVVFPPVTVASPHSPFGGVAILSTALVVLPEQLADRHPSPTIPRPQFVYG
jgi:hypothetical protein